MGCFLEITGTTELSFHFTYDTSASLLKDIIVTNSFLFDREEVLSFIRFSVLLSRTVPDRFSFRTIENLYEEKSNQKPTGFSTTFQISTIWNAFEEITISGAMVKTPQFKAKSYRFSFHEHF